MHSKALSLPVKPMPPAAKAAPFCCTDTAAEAACCVQGLDDTGDTGRISYILSLLDNPKFLDTCLAGEHRLDEIMQFWKITTNRHQPHAAALKPHRLCRILILLHCLIAILSFAQGSVRCNPR
jgi:hypothetical protein